ncbi:hypothetical protein AO825_00515 [Pectobacterium brasiliense]|nr:hypothetical protein KS44_11075 [Pectobacterium brasiliense]KRF66100.1 hypothetical protein AO825_00515 [Pectobacterium brasiliense]
MYISFEGEDSSADLWQRKGCFMERQIKPGIVADNCLTTECGHFIYYRCLARPSTLKIMSLQLNCIRDIDEYNDITDVISDGMQ